MVHCSEWLHYALARVETRDAVVFSLHLVPPSSTHVALVCSWNGQGQYLQSLHLHLYYIAICSFVWVVEIFKVAKKFSLAVQVRPDLFQTVNQCKCTYLQFMP